MGNSWKGIDDEVLAQCEELIMGFTGMPRKEFEVKNVQINDEGDYVRTIVCGNVSYISLSYIYSLFTYLIFIITYY